MHVDMNFRKHELLDTQNLLFPIVFSILHKTPNATILFRPTIFHFIIVFLSRVSILLLTRDIDIVILSVRLSVCP